MQIERLFARICKKQVRRIKLAAIAKNEAAYLCEWIFHHLYFGFDHIEIHYNGCTDNTADLAALLVNYPVSFICADETFNQPAMSPQVAVYRQVLRSSAREGYDAVLFLDIDEFWTPADLSSSIKDVMASMTFFDTLSFQWKNKYEQNELFAPAIQKSVLVDHVPQIKSVFKTYLRPNQMNAHGVVDAGYLQLFENGKEAKFTNEQKSRVNISETPENAFILHRKERSEKEYIASLLRGRPINTNNEKLVLKNNRRGFSSDTSLSLHNFPSQSFIQYCTFLLSKQSAELNDFQKLAQNNVLKTYQSVLQLIENPTSEQKGLLKKLLQGVKDKNVTEVTAMW